MNTVLVWLMFQVYPIEQPVKLTDTAVTCVILADKEMQKNPNQILRCVPIQILVEEI
jgi:hypothetical protein